LRPELEQHQLKYRLGRRPSRRTRGWGRRWPPRHAALPSDYRLTAATRRCLASAPAGPTSGLSRGAGCGPRDRRLARNDVVAPGVRAELHDDVHRHRCRPAKGVAEMVTLPSLLPVLNTRPAT
jgi:hypothetical protein